MANLNKVMLIGRLTRDPEFRAFATGGRVAKFGFAVTNRRKNTQTGEWEDEPMFIDCEVFNRGETGKQADLIERFGLHKGSQIFIEGRLHLDQWDDKTSGQKRSKHRLVVDNFQLLDPKPMGDGSGPAPQRSSAPARGPMPQRAAPQGGSYYEDTASDNGPPTDEGSGDIPF